MHPNKPCPCGSGKKFKKCCGNPAVAVPTRTAPNLPALIQQGVACHRSGRLSEAEAIYRQALQAAPRDAGLLHLLGTLLSATGRYAEAAAVLEKAIVANPQQAAYHNDCGEAYRRQGQLDQAITCYRRALQIDPGFGDGQYNLGVALAAQGKHEQAAQCYRAAIRLNPKDFEAHTNLGEMLRELGKAEDALACYRDALAIRPDLPVALNGLGVALTVLGCYEEAVGHLRQAIALRPDFPAASNNLGSALSSLGRHDEAIASYRDALRHDPDFVLAHSNLLLDLLYAPGLTPEEIFAEHLRFDAHFGAPLARSDRHPNPPQPERKLLIGYISADFRRHPVATFFAPLLVNHDRAQFEIFCYYTHTRVDAETEFLRRHADHWLGCAGFSDEALAQRIREDGIDILVDLSGHTASNRLLVFARKPAPVQATWLGYLHSTGLAAMDYRISDHIADPVGVSERFHTETLVRLPDAQWCYRAPEDAPPVNSLPALERGHLTFGSFNVFQKINAEVIRLWAQLLARLPEARLVMAGVPPSAHDALRQSFCELGVAASRLDLHGTVPRTEFFALHHQVDVALDSFPYSGGTTTCESLWMGVPTLTLPGATTPSRSAASLMAEIGLAEYVASGTADWLDRAAALDSERPRLAALRTELRTRMHASPLMDGPRFARSLEQAYRQMWRQWCAVV